ncbi:hypothetical protein DM01DRAFT_1339909 [Hesseltinella vesiculosa]|uniref:Uncharacterized protein n=1 Tax=Hesseltinella vesiculosa TaxID=101127 RepID=A0A1X2G5M7_9FUNG|nr:hypothetical protein DM01DRAFT_1339909 [Hesseltinella vesiculosa]
MVISNSASMLVIHAKLVDMVSSHPLQLIKEGDRMAYRPKLSTPLTPATGTPVHPSSWEPLPRHLATPPSDSNQYVLPDAAISDSHPKINHSLPFSPPSPSQSDTPALSVDSPVFVPASKRSSPVTPAINPHAPVFVPFTARARVPLFVPERLTESSPVTPAINPHASVFTDRVFPRHPSHQPPRPVFVPFTTRARVPLFVPARLTVSSPTPTNANHVKASILVDADCIPEPLSPSLTDPPDSCSNSSSSIDQQTSRSSINVHAAPYVPVASVDSPPAPSPTKVENSSFNPKATPFVFLGAKQETSSSSSIDQQTSRSSINVHAAPYVPFVSVDSPPAPSPTKVANSSFNPKATPFVFLGAEQETSSSSSIDQQTSRSSTNVHAAPYVPVVSVDSPPAPSPTKVANSSFNPKATPFMFLGAKQETSTREEGKAPLVNADDEQGDPSPAFKFSTHAASFLPSTILSTTQPPALVDVFNNVATAPLIGIDNNQSSHHLPLTSPTATHSFQIDNDRAEFVPESSVSSALSMIPSDTDLYEPSLPSFISLPTPTRIKIVAPASDSSTDGCATPTPSPFVLKPDCPPFIPMPQELSQESYDNPVEITHGSLESIHTPPSSYFF